MIGDATATGVSSTANGATATAYGQGSTANGDTATAYGQGSTANGSATTAIGQASNASGTGATALGATAQATADSAIAVGNNAAATFTNFAAIGTGAATTRINQVAIGTGTNTYTLAGINSAASLAAQTGTLRVVTTGAAGNLASAPLPTDLSGSVATLQSQVTTLQGQVKQAFEGTAIAIALGASTLPGDKRYAVTVNWGNFRGENAMSLAAQYRVTDYVVLNAGVAAGFAQGGVGSRAGVTFAW